MEHTYKFSPLVNLILTVIVERAAEAREKDLHDLLEQKAQVQQQMKMDLLRLCSQLDRGGNGRMTLEDLEWAFNASNEFRLMMMTLMFTMRGTWKQSLTCLMWTALVICSMKNFVRS